MSWRMKEPCIDCPFSDSPQGQHLARTLRLGRMRSIKFDLLHGQYFVCHKTSDETGDGSNLVCAGALAFQEEHGVSSNYQRVCERLEFSAAQRALNQTKSVR